MFDKAKLEALRAKYAGAKETEVGPVEFRKALSLVFGTNYRRAMPFAGVSTFLDLPYRPDAPDLANFGGLDVALTRNVFLRAEYEYVQFAPIANLVVDVNSVRGGLGVKF